MATYLTKLIFQGKERKKSTLKPSKFEKLNLFQAQKLNLVKPS